MSHKSEPITPAELEAYLDQLLSPSEREACEARLRGDPESAAQVELQMQIDTSLLRTFKVQSPPPESVEVLLARQSQFRRVASQRWQTLLRQPGRRGLIWVAIPFATTWEGGIRLLFPAFGAVSVLEGLVGW